MVQTKKTPHHAEVRPLKCIVYITQNPVTFVIQGHHGLFLEDQQVCEKKHSEAYKRHVHRMPRANSTATLPEETSNSRRHETRNPKALKSIFD